MPGTTHSQTPELHHSRFCIQLQTIFTDVLQTCLEVSLHNSKYILNCFSAAEVLSLSNGTWINTTPKLYNNHCVKPELHPEKHLHNVKTNTKPLCILFYAVWKYRQVAKCIVNFLKTMIALLIRILLQEQCTNICQSNFHWNNPFFGWNRNSCLTSDIDISSRWFPSKHFQATNIFTVKLLCLKKNEILSNFCNDWKNYGGQNIANTNPNMSFEKKNILTLKNNQFFKIIKYSANPSLYFFHFKSIYCMSCKRPTN